jgi:uncharacterized iron-regulated protein
MLRRSGLLALVVGMIGCAHGPTASPSQPQPQLAEAPLAAGPVALPHRAVDGEGGAELSEPALERKLRAARVVFVGEEHPNPHHHAAQLELLERAYAADPSLGLGLEMLPRTLQAPLDAYVAGTLDEGGFLRAVDWEHNWGFPWAMYRPLVEFCRAHHLPAYALNAPRELAHAVAKSGVAGLTPSQRQELPELKPGPEAHREFVREAFAQHPHGKFDEARFERFYQAQLLWDETMADRIAAALKSPGAPAHVLVIAGEGHTRAWAIPDRAARRGAAPYLTVLPVLDEDEADARHDHVADILWVLRAIAPPSRPVVAPP